MNNRTDMTDQTQTEANAPSLTREAAKAFSQVAATAIFVSAGLYPFEVIQTVGQINNKDFIPKDKKQMFSLAFLSPLFQGYKNALKGSLIKSGLHSQREHLHRQINEAPVEKEGFLQEGPSFSYANLRDTVKTASVMSGLDTAGGQYWSNMRIAIIAQKTPVFPEVSPLRQPIKYVVPRFWFGYMGLYPRLARNFTNAGFGLCGITILGEPMRATFPKEQYGPLADALTVITTGALGGMLMTPTDVLAKNMVSQADFVRFTTPGHLKVATMLWNEGGISAFFRGSAYNALTTTIAYAIVLAVANAFNNLDKANAAEATIERRGSSTFVAEVIAVSMNTVSNGVGVEASPTFHAVTEKQVEPVNKKSPVTVDPVEICDVSLPAKSQINPASFFAKTGQWKQCQEMALFLDKVNKTREKQGVLREEKLDDIEVIVNNRM